MIPPRPGAVIQASYADLDQLHASYLPFIIDGAIFVASQQPVELGQEIMVVAGLPGKPQKFPINGFVVWVNQVDKPGRPQGFAVQLVGDKGLVLRLEIEKILGNRINSDQPTFTL